MKKLFTTFLMVALCAFVANAQGIGWVKVTTGVKSKGASLYVDGKYVSDIPATVALTEGTHKVVLKKNLYLDQEMNITVQANKIVDVGVDLIKNYSDVKITSVPPVALIYIDGTYVGIGNDMTLPILYGEHKIKVTHPEYYDYERTFTVTSNTSSLNLPALQPRIGYLVVNKNIENARVLANGEKISNKTAVRIGDYAVVVSSPGYTKYEQVVSVKDGMTTTVNAFLEKLYDLNIETNRTSPTIRVNGVGYAYENYPRQVVAGEYEVSVEKKGYKTKTKKIKYPEQESVSTHYFKLPEYQFVSPNSFYVGWGAQAMRYAGIRFDIGGYIRNINLEFTYTYGFKRAVVGNVPFYIDNYYGEPSYYELNYTPKGYFGITAGYGINIGTILKLTPQVGLGVIAFTGDVITGGASAPNDFVKFSTGAFNTALKLDFGFAKTCAYFLSPGYTVGFAGKESLASTVMNINPDVRTKYVNGFNLSVGMRIYLED